jgi:plastocyanin
MLAKILRDARKRLDMQRCTSIGPELRLDVQAEKALQEKRAPVGIPGKEIHLMAALKIRLVRLCSLTLLALLFALTFGNTITNRIAAADKPHVNRMVIVPEEDRFSPFALTIRSGEDVEWVNMDTDDHTVVSNDFFNTAGHNGTNVLLLGTDNNNGRPGTFRLHFSHPGTFHYYCRFHAHLDSDHQPVAPGPDGGIQDANGNFGTPMMGVITVLPGPED